MWRLGLHFWWIQTNNVIKFMINCNILKGFFFGGGFCYAFNICVSTRVRCWTLSPNNEVPQYKAWVASLIFSWGHRSSFYLLSENAEQVHFRFWICYCYVVALPWLQDSGKQTSAVYKLTTVSYFLYKTRLWQLNLPNTWHHQDFSVLLYKNIAGK